MVTVNMPAVRDELVATLEETLRLQQRLMNDVRDEGVAVADLVAQVTVLERLDDRRDHLMDQLRRTASAGMRPARTSRPVREVLLETLADFRWPQNAGFLEEYLLAKHQLQLDSRAFAPLRRDERNAWDRSPGAREAYIAPGLKPDGSANPRWITRSDWAIERRIVATPRTERLFDLYKIYVLAGRPGSAEAGYVGSRRAVDALLEKYAQDVLDTEPPSASVSDDEFSAWRADVRERAGTLIGEVRRDDEPDRKQIARQLVGLSEREHIWGRDAGIKPRGRSDKRPMTSASDEELRSRCPVRREARARPWESALRYRTTQIGAPPGRGPLDLPTPISCGRRPGWRLV